MLTVPTSTILQLEHGIWADYPSELYHERVPGLASKSALDLVNRSLAHYQAWLRGSERDTKALAFGKALHTAVLEPDVFDELYIPQPDFGDCRLKDNKANRAAWRTANGIDGKGAPQPGGRIALPPVDIATIRGISRNIQKHTYASRMIADGASEVTMRWRDPKSGIECKGRVDYYVARHAAAWDVKTCEDAREPAFARSVETYRYHVQHALYAGAFNLLGKGLDYFAFIACEKTPPYNLKVHTLNPEYVADGVDEAQADLVTLATGFETGLFGGYDDDISVISRPSWARKRERNE